jgi:hypothetical protein
VGFLSGRKQEDDDELPGSGLHLDTEVKICPACRREALPWQATCAECGVATVTADQLPASELPHLDLSTLGDDAPEAQDEDDQGQPPGAR